MTTPWWSQKSATLTLNVTTNFSASSHDFQLCIVYHCLHFVSVSSLKIHVRHKLNYKDKNFTSSYFTYEALLAYVPFTPGNGQQSQDH